MNLGASELMLVLVIVLLLFGGKRLPELARSLGKGLSEFRRATQQVQRELASPLNDAPGKPATPSEPAPLATERNQPTVHAHPAAQPRTAETPPASDS